ncbi:hypothetical protein [Catellatospora methionotrophica]|uniref:hypothetical protein n=1 Tax=Catellatospora methionotrophica TaxID=121620 RepID=UPI0033D5935B
MAFRYTLTALANQQFSALRGRQKLAVLDFLILIEAQGCAAMGYRLTGGEPLERICVKHLEGTWRIAVAFASEQHAWILLIGEHDAKNPDRDIYATLYLMIDQSPPSGMRTKPACCDPAGLPPIYDQAEFLADRLRALRRGRR